MKPSTPSIDPLPRTPTARAPRAAASPEEYIRRILQSDDFPAFSRHMNQLMGSLEETEASAQRLANLVLRDYALTVKVIRTANTVHYNRTGRPVQSATQAMMLLGARTVRALAGELLLFEHYRKRSPGLKELMLLSLLTAGHAREAAVRLGLGDPEAAQLAGMFRNLGEVLVAAHLPQEYAAILRETAPDGAHPALVSRRARDAAAVHTLGCSFADIGIAIAGGWGMPEHVCRGMRATGQGGDDALGLVTAFADDLTAAIHRASPPSAREGITAVLETYGRRLRLSRDVLASVADAAVAATREAFAAAGVALDDLRLTRQITLALNEQPASIRSRILGVGRPAEETAPREATAAHCGDEPSAASPPALGPAAEAETTAAPTAPSASADAVDAPAGAPPTAGTALAALRDRLTQDVEAAAADPGLYDLQRTLLVALEAGLRGGPFDHVCFCAPDPRVTELRARLALGDRSEALVARLRVPVTPAPAAVGAALLRGEEVLLSHSGRLTPADAALLRGAGAGAAGLLPVVVDGIAIGCVYFDRADRPGGRAALDDSALAYMRRLTAIVTRAVSTRRGPTAAAAPSPAKVAAAGASAATLHAAETKAAAVLRLLRGARAEELSAELGVPTADLEGWQRDFLAGAVARLAAG